MKAHKIIFLLFLFFLPSQLGYHFWPGWSFVRGVRVDYLSPTLYFTDLIILSLLTLVFFDNELVGNLRSFLIKHKKNFLILLIFAVFNIIYSSCPLLTFYKWITLFKLVFLGTYVYLQDASLKQISTVLGLSTLIIFISFCMQTVLQKSNADLFYLWGERRFTVSTPAIARFSFLGRVFLRPYSFFPHPNSLAGFCIGVLPLFLGLPKSIFKYLVVTASCFMVAFSLSQNAILAGVVLVVLYLLKSRLPLNYIFAVVVVFSFLTPLLLLLFSRVGPSVSRRFGLALISLYMLRDNLFTGVGFGNYIYKLYDYYQKSYSLIIPEASYWIQPVHNIFLLIASETGFIGLLVLFIFFFNNLKRNFIELPLYFSLLGILLTGLWDHYWLTLPQNQLLMTIILGLFFRQTRLAKTEENL